MAGADVRSGDIDSTRLDGRKADIHATMGNLTAEQLY